VNAANSYGAVLRRLDQGTRDMLTTVDKCRNVTGSYNASVYPSWKLSENIRWRGLSVLVAQCLPADLCEFDYFAWPNSIRLVMCLSYRLG
jgi:hypothetical protein